MTSRELRNGRKVKYLSEDSGSDSGPSTSRSTRDVRVSAREAARLLSNLADSEDDRRVTRQPRSSDSQKKPKDLHDEEGTEESSSTVLDEDDDDDDDDSTAARETKNALAKVAKKQNEKRVKARSSSSRLKKEENFLSYRPEKRERQSPRQRTEPPPKPKKVMAAKKVKTFSADTEEDKKKRLEYLLRQSETLAHIMTSGGAEQSPKRGRKKAEPSRQELSSSQQSADHRHARRGSSEDKELVQLADDAVDITRFEKTPFYIQGGEMRDYQVRGLNWLISLCQNKINGILADEMGLGKTLQTISLLGYMYNVKKSDLPHLIIVPKSTLSNWQAEFRKWCPSLESALLKGDQDERTAFIKATKVKRNWDVLVTSYEIALREQAFLRRHFWGYVVIDEAHRIKNESSMLATAVRTFRSSRRLLLTGTPLQNNLHELWALLNFLLPDIFESAEDFDSWFGDQECQADMSLVERLHSILRPFLLRRVKADVEKNLPPKTEIKLFVGLTPMQRTWYKNVLLKDVTVMNAVHGVNSSALHNVLMHLRKVCNHPYLFEGAEPGPPYTTERHIVDNCGKMILLHKLLTRLKENGSRVLIFSQMTRALDVLEDYCTWADYQYCRLDGSTAHEDREEAIQDFNAPRSKKFIFLLSTRAGGLGINLTSADTVILYGTTFPISKCSAETQIRVQEKKIPVVFPDSDWNPQVDLQAMDRVHRIGQTKPVTVFRLITENTVEERIIERAERKFRLDALVIQSGRLVDQATRLDRNEMLNMIRFGAHNIIHSSDVDINNITDEDIDTILAKGKMKTQEMNKKFGELTEDKLRVFSNDYSEKNVYQFEGEDYRSKQAVAAKLDELEQNWIALPKRERRQLYDLSGASTSGRDRDRDSPSWMPGCGKPKPGRRVSVPRPPLHRFIDIHFAPPRLLKLLDREQLSYKKTVGFKLDIDPDLPEDVRARMEADQAKIDASEPLTVEEEKEKMALMSETFSNWRRPDVACLLRGLEQYGPTAVEKIALFVKESKTLEEVKAYLPVFLSRYETLVDGAKIKIRIQRGILQQDKQKKRREALKMKIDSSGFPEMDMKIPYPNGYIKSQQTQTGLSNTNSNSRMIWLEEEDRFLLCAYAAACQTFPDDSDEMLLSIREAVRNTPRFRFNYLMRSIGTDKVKERLEVLLNWIVKEAFPPPTIMNNKPIFVSQNLLNGLTTCTSEQEKKDASRFSSGTSISDAYHKLTIGLTGSSPDAAKTLPSSFPKTFTLKYVDAKEGKFLMTPSSGPSTSGVTVTSATTPAGTSASKTEVYPKKAFVVQPKVLTMASSPAKSTGKSATPTVVAKVSSASGAKAIVPSSGKKLPVWAMAADASASKSGSTALLRVKRKEPDDSTDDDDDVVEVYASKNLAKKTFNANTSR